MRTQWAWVTHSPVGKCRLWQSERGLTDRVRSNCHAFLITCSGEKRGINRCHGDTQPPERVGDNTGPRAKGISTGSTYDGSWRWPTTPTHIRNDTGHWTKRKSGHSVRGRGLSDGAGCATLTGWLPWPGCELAYARAPNSIYILIKTAPLASPTPTHSPPANAPNSPPIHPTPVFLFVKASTIKYISVQNVGEAVRAVGYDIETYNSVVSRHTSCAIGGAALAHFYDWCSFFHLFRFLTSTKLK